MIIYNGVSTVGCTEKLSLKRVAKMILMQMKMLFGVKEIEVYIVMCF